MLLVLNFTLGLFVSIDQGWAYEFGGIGDPDNVSGQWMEKGTYLAPPLAPALAFLAGLALSLIRGFVGALGAVLMMLVCVLFLIGTVGEPWDPRGFDPPLAVILLFRAWSIAAIVGVLVFGVLPLRDRLRRRRSAVPV
jgi:hypothetical protein